MKHKCPECEAVIEVSQEDADFGGMFCPACGTMICINPTGKDNNK